jgi:hypothetical protein
MRCCWHLLIRKRILKLRATYGRSRRSLGQIEIKIASEQNRRLPVVSPSVVQGLLKLGVAQRVVTFAFQVQVICCNCSPGDVYVAG